MSNTLKSEHVTEPVRGYVKTRFDHPVGLRRAYTTTTGTRDGAPDQYTQIEVYRGDSVYESVRFLTEDLPHMIELLQMHLTALEAGDA